MKTIAIAALFLVAPLGAQTTGVPNVNDYTVVCAGCPTGTLDCFQVSSLGGTSGSTTGTPASTILFDLSAGGVMTFSVDGAPGNSFVALYYSLGVCPAIPVALGNVTTYSIPATSIFPSTNQTLDMGLSFPLNLLISGPTNASGDFSASIPFPPLFASCATICTQAVIFDGFADFGYLVSQAYKITFI